MGTPKQKVRGSSKSLSQLGFREQEERKKRNRILFLDSIGHNHQASGLRALLMRIGLEVAVLQVFRSIANTVK